MKCWVYHKTKEPIIVNKDEAQSYYKKGWADSPAKFIKTTDFGVDPKDKLSVQNLGETIEGVKDQLNGSLNLDEMSKDELEDYALKHFGKDIDKRKSIENLIKEVQGLIDGNST